MTNLSAEDNIIQYLRLVGLLKDLPRTGWVRKGVDTPETVSGHMYRMSLAALALAESEGLDAKRCVRMALVHDLAEAEVGDICPHDPVSSEEKHRLERESMVGVRALLNDANLAGPGEEILELWDEYEAQETPEARFVKDLDKFDMILQAAEYEHNGRVPRAVRLCLVRRGLSV